MAEQTGKIIGNCESLTCYCGYVNKITEGNKYLCIDLYVESKRCYVTKRVFCYEQPLFQELKKIKALHSKCYFQVTERNSIVDIVK